MDFDNPAARLFDFLARVKAHGNMVTRQAVCIALDLDQDQTSLSEVLQHITTVMSWPAQIEDRVRALTDVNAQRLLRWQPHVKAAMTELGNAGGMSHSIIAQYNDTDLADLEHCADTLHYRTPEPSISPDDLSSIIDLIREAIDAIGADEQLAPAARLWLIGRLREVENAVLHFRIVGYSGVTEAMERLCGGIVLHPLTRNQQASSWATRIWLKISNSLTGVDRLAVTSTNTANAINAGLDLFGGGS